MKPTALPKSDYVVLNEPQNALRIAGRRREKGEVVSLSGPEAEHFVLEGILAPHAPAAPQPRAQD